MDSNGFLWLYVKNCRYLQINPLVQFKNNFTFAICQLCYPKAFTTSLFCSTNICSCPISNYMIIFFSIANYLSFFKRLHFSGLMHKPSFPIKTVLDFVRTILTKPSIAHFSSFSLFMEVGDGALIRNIWSIKRASWLLYTPEKYNSSCSVLFICNWRQRGWGWGGKT